MSTYVLGFMNFFLFFLVLILIIYYKNILFCKFISRYCCPLFIINKNVTLFFLRQLMWYVNESISMSRYCVLSVKYLPVT